MFYFCTNFNEIGIACIVGLYWEFCSGWDSDKSGSFPTLIQFSVSEVLNLIISCIIDTRRALTGSKTPMYQNATAFHYLIVQKIWHFNFHKKNAYIFTIIHFFKYEQQQYCPQRSSSNAHRITKRVFTFCCVLSRREAIGSYLCCIT